HLYVCGICREFALVFFAKIKRVSRLWQQPVEKLDIAWMKIVIKLVKARMRDDHHSAFSQKRLVAKHVEVITESHHLNEERIQRRIDVVRRDVRNAGDHDVALAFD